MSELRNRLRKRMFSAITLCCVVLPSYAAVNSATLLSAFHDAIQYDPVYQSQLAAYQAVYQQLPESYSALLPQLDVNAALNRQWDHIDGTGNGDYTLHNYGLTVNQTLFDWSEIRRVSREAYTVRSAATELAYHQQELMIRTAQAYYAVLQQQDILDDTRQQVQILSNQLNETNLLYEHKEATITELDQVKGAYYNILNDLEEAQLNLYTAQQNLTAITSVPYSNFARLKSSFPLITPQPEKLAEWEQEAAMKNLKLNASRLEMEAARRNISVERGGYLPTLSAEGGYSQAKEPTTSDDGLTTQHAENRNIGLNLTWHAFEGGFTTARVKQAEANYEQATSDMHRDYLNTLSQARTAYEGVLLGRLSILDAREAVKWNLSALQHAQEGFRSGEQTMTDLLEIQNRLFSAQIKYVRDTYSYLNAILLLKQASGMLSVHDLSIQNNWLTSKTI